VFEQGYLDIMVEGKQKRIGVTRIHIEEDAGKLLHQGADSIEGATHSLVDANRAGTPLIEIVSEPDIRSAKEARAYVETLKTIVQHLGVCDGNLEEGSLRADINISLRPVGTEAFGTRAEVKNVNSFRSIEQAIEYEIKRQTKVLRAGEKVVQETRNFDEAAQRTTSLRGKEEAHDYRYFPEPDLPPLLISDAELSRFREELPLLPEQKLKVYQEDYALSAHECKVLMGDVDMDGYFRVLVSKVKKSPAKRVALWVTGELNAAIKEKKQGFGEMSIAVQQVADLSVSKHFS
jgi:aspartyl-tRNA(Asn)/glutamyl-tRNA(Gln) amidotransferase subunit B